MPQVRYSNNTGRTSKVGALVKLNPKNPKGFISAEPGDIGIIGTVAEKVPNNNSALINLINTVSYDDIIDASTNFQPLNANLTRLATYGRIGGDVNYSQFDADGTLTFVGDATNWDDIRIVPTLFDVIGNTDPSIVDYQPGGSGSTFKMYAFAKGDEGFFTIQLPHSYKPESDLKAHVHWTPGSRGVAENTKVVQWRLDYTITSIGSNFGTAQTISIPGTCSGIDHKHEKTAGVTIAGTGLGISSQLIGKIYRWNDASDTWVGTTAAELPIFIEFDIHFEQNSVGSRQPTSK